MRNHVRFDREVTKFSTPIDVSYFMVEDRMEMGREREFKGKRKILEEKERLSMD